MLVAWDKNMVGCSATVIERLLCVRTEINGGAHFGHELILVEMWSRLLLVKVVTVVNVLMVCVCVGGGRKMEIGMLWMEVGVVWR
jgi:hypothetical protein